MSLFNELQWEIIEKPRSTYNYAKILETQKESEEEKAKREKAERKALCAEKKKEMSKEEFELWRRKAYYQLQKEERIEKQLDKYYKNKREEEALLEEIYKDVYDPIPEPINYDKYYLEKFKDDDRDSDNKYRFSWRSSKIIFENWKTIPRYRQPIRIYWRKWVEVSRKNLLKKEIEAYKLLLPHLPELKDERFMLKKKQTLTKYPLRNVNWNLAKITMNSDIAPSHICNVLDAIHRDKYIASEAYLWRNSFIIWDMLVTQTGNKFQPCLENNIPWLTPETVEDIHEVRMQRRKHKGKEKPPIYMVPDAYLVKIPINEWETYFYIIPT